MIKISVDTEKELNIVRRVLRDEACSHTACNNLKKQNSLVCDECVERYCENMVELYKREIVEIPERVVV